MPHARFVRSPQLADTPYAHAATATSDAGGGEGTWIWTAGACPLDGSGRVVAPGDVVAQAHQVVANLRVALEEAGATFADLVRTTVYVATSERADLVAVWDVVHDAVVGSGGHEPPSTLLGVSVLGWPDQLVEVEAVALVPGG